jgi:hypothetical protein
LTKTRKWRVTRIDEEGVGVTEEPMGPRMTWATAWILEPLTLRPFTATRTSPLCTWDQFEYERATACAV